MSALPGLSGHGLQVELCCCPVVGMAGVVAGVLILPLWLQMCIAV